MLNNCNCSVPSQLHCPEQLQIILKKQTWSHEKQRAKRFHTELFSLLTEKQKAGIYEEYEILWINKMETERRRLEGITC